MHDIPFHRILRIAFALVSPACVYDWSIRHDAGADAHLAEPDPQGVDANDESSVSDAPTEGPDAEWVHADVDAGMRLCYADLDGDGVGAGPPIACDGLDALVPTDELTDAPLQRPSVSTRDDDCDDGNAARSPSLSDVCGDNIDNDCDEVVDDESNNACGGPCRLQLGHQPGESCKSSALGVCTAEGLYECSAEGTIRCGAISGQPSPERCGDELDNDCDGQTDEADAVDATTWFQDCDRDGFSGLSSDLASAGIGVRVACIRPNSTNECAGWTSTVPSGIATTDCDDSSPAYRPGASFGIPPTGKTRTDLNCDGIDEKDPTIDVLDFRFPEPRPFINLTLCSAYDSCQSCNAKLYPSGRWPAGSPPHCSSTTSDLSDFEVPRLVCQSSADFATYTAGGLQRCR